MTIHAFTETGSAPAYVNLTKSPIGARLTVRTRGSSASSHIDLDDEQLDALAQSILDHLYQEVP